ncbi:MAG: molybdopterin-dependent oxidoreductase [Sulfurospirillaceae bacterium]|nr:molybdopterin-dependent oxidoreductase [Sulfurospirillaceae bacterium]
MEIEISRRRFLQGSVALSVIAASESVSFAEKNDTKSNIISSYGISKTSKDGFSVPTLCEICVNKCALLARVENGVVTKLDPNPYFPKSKNMLCPRGNAGIQALYDPDRLKFPLIRDGQRGSGKFKRVTWDEAYTYINEKMVKILDEEKDNRSTFLFCAGEGMAEETFKTFYQVFGSSNWLNHASLCLQTVTSAYGLTLGAYPQADFENATYVIMAGANRAEAIVTPDTMDLFKRTEGRGAKLVYVDPIFTNTAAKADQWLAIKPGTDLAFVLALTYVVLSEKLYNESYVTENFNDFEAYQEHILSHHYTPQWAEKITGISAATIEQVAREFMQHAPQSIYYPGRRSTFARSDFQLRRAMAIFQALGGGIDIKGGLVFGKGLGLSAHEEVTPIYANSKARAIKKKEQVTKGQAGYEDCAIVSGGGSWIGWRNRFLEGKMPYKVRGMFVYKHNPVLNMPNTAKTIEMLQKMDLVVTIDTMPSDTVMYADVVLPECTYLERTDPVKTFGGVEPSIAQRNKVIEPMFESKPVLEIMRGLSAKISKPLFEVAQKYDEDIASSIEDSSYDEVYAEFDLTKPFTSSQEALNEHAVAKYPDAVKSLKEKGVYYPEMQTFFKQLSANTYQHYPEKAKAYTVNAQKPKTSSKKVECNLANLADKGVDAMPTWKDDFEFIVPEGKFRLITGRHAQFTQSGTGNNAMLRELISENYIWINQGVATKKGISFGDKIEVSSTTGKTVLKAYPTEKIGPNMVFFIHGFGSESKGLSLAYRRGGNDNAVIEDKIEPVYGASVMHETNVTLRKV